MKVFDWDIAKTKGSPERYNWLYKNHKKKISEEDFVTAFLALKKFRLGKSYKYSPSRLKFQYRLLVKNFGFFQ